MLYSTVAAWQSYATARGNLAPAAATADDAASALQRGSDHIRLHYIARGVPADAPEIAEAVHIAASIELDAPGAFSVTYTPGQDKILVRVGDLQWHPARSGSGAVDNVPVSLHIEALLRQYLGGTGVAVFVV
ncbi:hypothetical protein [Profundibacterium mesophilum]|uniref:Uncharacterized protein n=1 Tax=Profundibacterium mesophilum KAUST100406-0324 TaxID=1037889 RepID=A0A921NQ65_9RHOB|nr:hypothetical protein [Profundibacterium mesophilum]KAF0675077.1 hypothetical protein PMES_02598 [Profundibacterium mesophilum KAUST100406-0324]